MTRETKDENMPPALSMDDLMSVLGIKRGTAYSLVHTGQIRSVRVSNQILIPRDAVRDFLQGLPPKTVCPQPR